MRSSTPLLPLAAALAALAALAVPASADATALTYTAAGNVHVASPDGAQRRQLTSDGTTQAPYRFPSASDAGDLVAIRRIGESSSQAMYVFRGLGGQPTINTLPWKTSMGGGNYGPTGGRVKPSNAQIAAYSYIWNKGLYEPLVSRIAVSTTDGSTSPTQPLVELPNFLAPSWHGERLVGSNGSAIVYETEPAKMTTWLSSSDGWSLQFADVSRAGDRVLVEMTKNGTDAVAVYAYAGTIPNGNVTGGCVLPVQGASEGAALSADGTRVAWADAAGVRVARLAGTAPQPGGECTLKDVVTLAPQGAQPAFTETTLPVPPPTGGGGGTPPPATGGGTGTPPADGGAPADPGPTTGTGTGTGGTTTTTSPGATTTGSKTATGSSEGTAANGVTTAGGASVPAPALTVSAPASLTAAALRRGAQIKVSVPKAGKAMAKLTLRGKVLATASGRAAAARTLTLKLKGRPRRGTATLTVTFTPASGPTSKTTAKVRVR